MKDVLFAPMAYSRYEANQTLPAKFDRLLAKSGGKSGDYIAEATV